MLRLRSKYYQRVHNKSKISTNETVFETSISHRKEAEQEYFILMESGYFWIVGSNTLEIKIAYV
jgi:hypothetical protein